MTWLVRVLLYGLLILANGRLSLGSDDPFVDEANQCVVEVGDALLQQLTDTLQTALECDGLWGNLLLHFHYTRQNLTECRARGGTASTSEPSASFCQVLVDDARRQADQERRKHGAEMDQKLQEIRRDVVAHEGDIGDIQRNVSKLQDERRKLHMELLLTNIGVGESDQALRYYQRLTEGIAKPPDRLYKAIVQSVYRDAKQQNQRVEHLLEFTRKLSTTEPKLKLYGLLKVEVAKRTKQRDHYIAAMLALDVRELLRGESDNVKRQNEHLHKDLLEPLVKRWQEQIAAGSYGAVAEFATNQPKYFEQLESTLATVGSAAWDKNQFERLAVYPNSLPFGRQRVAAYEALLKQVYDAKRNVSMNYLLKLALHMEVCERFLKRQPTDQPSAAKLEQLKNKFMDFAGHGYGFYLFRAKKPT